MEVQLPRHHSQAFSQSLVIGAAAKEILRSLLEASQYKVYPFGYESSLSSLKMHIWDNHIQDSNAVERVRSMPDYVVSSEKGLKLVEVKFRKRSDHNGRPGVYLKNKDLSRYRQYWAESIITLISPFADRFFRQEVNNLIPGSGETKWFAYDPTLSNALSGSKFDSIVGGGHRLPVERCKILCLQKTKLSVCRTLSKIRAIFFCPT